MIYKYQSRSMYISWMHGSEEYDYIMAKGGSKGSNTYLEKLVGCFFHMYIFACCSLESKGVICSCTLQHPINDPIEYIRNYVKES